MDIERAVQQIAAVDGGVVSRQMLLSCGVAPADIEHAVRHRHLTVVRRGWYDAGTSDPAVVAAVRSGGVVTCISALARRDGVWSVPAARLHIRRSRHLRAQGQCSAYRPLATPRRAVDPIPEALACAARCASEEDFVAICDSVLRRPGWSTGDVAPLLEGAPLRVQRLLEEVDPRADSGIESLVRFRLRRRGIRLRTQVRIPDVGTVDMLVGDRLIIECDGKQHHLGQQFGKDRWRDLVSVADGYLVMRLSYAHVVHQWDEVLPFIRAVIRRRSHRDRCGKLSRSG